MPVTGAFETATLTVSPHDGTTAATLALNAPDGTSSAPSASTADGGATWTATVHYTMPGWWLLAWTVAGLGAGPQYEQVFVTASPVAGDAPAYVDLDLLKKRMKITDTDRDDLLTLHIQSASRDIDSACGRWFYLDDTATARKINPVAGRVDRRRDGELLLVDDIGDLTGFTVEAGDGTTFYTVASTLYDTWPDNALAKREPIEGLLHIQRFGWSGAAAVFSLVRQRIRVTARWGWPAIPAPIREAALIQAQRYYMRKDTPEGVAGSSEWGVIRMSNLDPDVRRLIGRYKIPGFGGGA